MPITSNRYATMKSSIYARIKDTDYYESSPGVSKIKHSKFSSFEIFSAGNNYDFTVTF